MTTSQAEAVPRSSDQVILDATLTLLARHGLAGVSMRAVAKEAGVAVGLANYHFDNKHALIGAALRRVGDQDSTMVAPAEPGVDPAAHLRASLRRTLDPDFLDPDYLSLRLQLWSLAGVDSEFAAINRAGQQRYLRGLADQIQAARPDLDRDDVERRAELCFTDELIG